MLRKTPVALGFPALAALSPPVSTFSARWSCAFAQTTPPAAEDAPRRSGAITATTASSTRSEGGRAKVPLANGEPHAAVDRQNNSARPLLPDARTAPGRPCQGQASLRADF